MFGVSGAFNFWTNSNMQTLWNNAGWLVGQAAPLLLIAFAAVAAGWVVEMIFTSFREDSEENEEDEDE